MEGRLLLLCPPQYRPIGDLLWSLFQLQGPRPSMATMYQTPQTGPARDQRPNRTSGDRLNVFGGGGNGGASLPKKDQRGLRAKVANQPPKPAK